MTTYVILLKGVNVGGKNIVPMKELKSHLENYGFNHVRTYIQSGNIVLQSDKDPHSAIVDILQSQFDLTIEVLTLSDAEFGLSVKNNPYSEHEGRFVHSYYCKETPKLDLVKLEKFILETESYQVHGNVFYLHAPDGIGRSKLVANIEACLGVTATGRNLNTINKLCAMVSIT